MVCAARVIFAAAAALSCGPVFAGGDFTKAAVGTTTAQFLKLAVNARATGMGEAYSAVADDASAMYWNPAGMINISTRSVVAMHAAYLADSSFDYLAYAQNAGDVGTWGVSLQYMNSGAITKTDYAGVDQGEFKPNDIALSLGFATYISGYNKYPEERFVLGVTAKIINSEIVDKDTAISADAGLLTPYYFDNRVQFALTVANTMGSLRFDNESYPLPLTIKAGLKIKVMSSLLLAGDAVAVRDNIPYMCAGMENRISVSETMALYLRGGFNTRAISDYDGFKAVSFGMGLGTDRIMGDYSFTPFGEIGNAHRLSMRFFF